MRLYRYKTAKEIKCTKRQNNSIPVLSIILACNLMIKQLQNRILPVPSKQEGFHVVKVHSF